MLHNRAGLAAPIAAALLLSPLVQAQDAADAVMPDDPVVSDSATATPMTSDTGVAPAMSTDLPADSSEDAPDEAQAADAADARAEEAAEVAQKALDEAFRYEANWQALTDDGEHEKAAELADTWFTDATIQYGEKSVATIAPLVHKAQSLGLGNKPRQAIESYRDAITLIERSLGAFAPQLVRPLSEMAAILQNEREHEAAVSALVRAKDITHRNAGIFNLEQEPLVQQLTGSYWQLGEIRQATREQRFLYGAAVKSYGKESVEIVPALQRWAQWNARIQRFPDARKIYYQALDILEQEYGPNDVRLVDTLNMIAQSFYDNSRSVYPREGAQALRRVVSIYEAQEFADQTDVMVARARLADWFMNNGRTNKALDMYREAIATAKEQGLDQVLIDAYFGAHRLLRTSGTPIGNINSSMQEELARDPGYVKIGFDIDKRGHARNVRVLEDTVNIISVSRVLRDRVKGSIFRPRFVNGEPAYTYGQRQIYLFDGSSGSPFRVTRVPDGVRPATDREIKVKPPKKAPPAAVESAPADVPEGTAPANALTD